MSRIQNTINQQTINKLYNQFHDTFKVVKNQQVAFDQVTKYHLRSTKTLLRADLYTKGYTQIKIN